MEEAEEEVGDDGEEMETVGEDEAVDEEILPIPRMTTRSRVRSIDAVIEDGFAARNIRIKTRASE